MKDSLTPQQRRLVKELATGKTQKAAGIAAGYAPKSAKSTVCDLLKRNDAVNAALYVLMLKRGLGDDDLLVPIKDALTAKRIISARVIVKSDDPTVNVIPANSRTDDFIEVEDHPTRLRAAELGIRLRHPDLFHPPKTPDTPATAVPRQLIVMIRTSADVHVTTPQESHANGD